MDAVAGMAPTGRRIAGPAYDLVEVTSPKGLKCTAVVYHDEFVDHPGLSDDLKPILGFLESPGIDGVVPLLKRDKEHGGFVYPTGTVWSVAELVRTYADLGETCGIRAGLELAYVAAQILDDLSERGEKAGVFNHGALSPWTILIKPDGQVSLVGTGLPPVEIFDFLDDDTLVPKEDSFRYCPPERLEDKPEDVSSDLFVVALVALELITGKPVYDGLLDDIRQQAARAEGAYRLYKWRDLLPDSVREAFGRALKFDMDARYHSANEFVYAMHDLLGTPDLPGASLHEVIRRVRGAKGKPVIGGKTAALTREELALMAAELDEDDAPARLVPPRKPRDDAEPEPDPAADAQRWGKVQRSGGPRRGRTNREGGGARDAGATASRPSGADALRADLRSSRDARTSGGSAREDLRASLKARLRGSGDTELRNRREPPAREEPRRDPEPRREAAPVRDTPKEDPASSSGGAAALLARLRSSAGRKSIPPEPPPRREPEPPRPEPPRAEAPRPEPPRAEQPRLEPPRAEPARPEPSRAEQPRPEPAPEPARGRVDPDEKVTFDVVVPGEAPQRMKLRIGDPLADTANRLVHALCPIPTDLSGQLTGWYRLAQNGRTWRGDQTADVLDPGAPVHLQFVPNRVLPMTVRVEGVEPPIRFQAPVGTAVPVDALVAHLQRWLSLPDAEWSVVIGGKALEPMQILEEYDPGPGFEVVVRR